MAAEPFPFIVGCGRSGTTLVRALLDSHPELAIPGESYFPVWLERNRPQYERRGFDVQRFVDDLVRDPWFRLWNIPEDVVRSGYREYDPDSFADAIRVAYRVYAASQGKTRFGDKTPTFVRHIPVLADLFPDAVFVHVVRDGRDVALSLLEAEWGPRTVGGAALQWRWLVRLGRQAGARLGPERYLEVRYEDVIEAPEREVQRLCRFAGLDFHEATLRYFERAPALLAGLPDPEEHQHLRLPPTKGLRNWRSQMSPADAALFEFLAGDLLEQSGYECETGRPAKATATRAAEEWARWRLKRGGRALRSASARLLHGRSHQPPRAV